MEAVQLDVHVDGDIMPWNISPLTAKERDNLRQWISGGALNDSFFKGTVARIFGDGVSLGARGGKCAYCHCVGAPCPSISPGSPPRDITGIVHCPISVRTTSGKSIRAASLTRYYGLSSVKACPGSS